MAKHLIAFGHGNGDTGATYGNKTEAGTVRKLRPYLKKWGDKSKDTFEFYDKNLFQQRAMRYQKGYKTVTELHLDSPKGNGGHVIINKSFKPDALDKRLRDIVKKHFGIVGYLQNAGGFSYRNNLYNINQAKTHGINYRLIEMFFLSNAADYNHFINNLDQIAKEIIEAITNTKVSGSAKPSKPSKPKPSKPKPSKPSSGGKSFDTMVAEVRAGKHGNGHENRRKSLGISKAEYEKVRAEVNRLEGVTTKPKPSGVKAGQTVTTRKLYSTQDSTRNVRTSNLTAYVADIDNRRRNPIRLRNKKGGYYVGFTRKEDLI